MKTLFSTLLIAVLALGFLLLVSTDKADAWYRYGPAVSFSVVVPPFGVSIGAPAPYYYPGYAYVAPPYPVYGRAYYSPYRPYYGYYGYRHWDHRGWRGDGHGNGHGRGQGQGRY